MRTAPITRIQTSMFLSLTMWVAVSGKAKAGITIKVPEHYQTINEAMFWAEDGDEVVVSPGVYHENVAIPRILITLRGTKPHDPQVVASTVIDGNRSGSVITLQSNVVITGLTIRNGLAFEGGGIYGHGWRPTISNNIIMGNQAGAGGGISSCCGYISSNLITSNTADFGGGIGPCGGDLINNVIVYNTAKQGGGLYASGLAGLDRIANNTIAFNAADEVGGGICGERPGYVVGDIVNSIVWGNTAPAGGQLHDCAIPSYSCVQGHTVGGTGNIGDAPLFVGPDDFRLQGGSPCIDSGTTERCPGIDMDGNSRPLDGDGDGIALPDMGAYEFPSPPTLIEACRWMLYR